MAKDRPADAGKGWCGPDALRPLLVRRRSGTMGACLKPLQPSALPVQTAANHETFGRTQNQSAVGHVRAVETPRTDLAQTESRASSSLVVIAGRRSGRPRSLGNVFAPRSAATTPGKRVTAKSGCVQGSTRTTLFATARSVVNLAPCAAVSVRKCTTRTTASRLT